jgi:hypothetical protein
MNMNDWWKITEELKYVEKNMSSFHEFHTDLPGVAPEPPQ